MRRRSEVLVPKGTQVRIPRIGVTVSRWGGRTK